MALRMSPDEKTVQCDAEPWFNPKKGGLIPPKRKLVKTMMLECLLKSIGSMFQSCCPSGPPSNPTRKSKNKNKKAIFSIPS
ncbi:hypothetical protein ACSBR1_001308 [Camellia fascicularis]